MLIYKAPAETNVTLVQIPNGAAGVHHTLKVMRSMVNTYKKSPVIRDAALSVTALTPEKDEQHQIKSLFEYVRDHVRYIKDIDDVETIACPEYVLQTRVGDCDDQSLLLATLAESIGIPSKFVIAGYNYPGVFEHVYVCLYGDFQWIPCDPTENFELGWSPPNPIVYYEERLK